MEEKYKEVIEIGLALIEEKLMVKFGLSTSDVESIMREYFAGNKGSWIIH